MLIGKLAPAFKKVVSAVWIDALAATIVVLSALTCAYDESVGSVGNVLVTLVASPRVNENGTFVPLVAALLLTVICPNDK